jgi:hypothetical protein
MPGLRPGPEPAGQVLTSSLPVGFDAAAQPVQSGPVRLFAGVRSDPFFADHEVGIDLADHPARGT